MSILLLEDKIITWTEEVKATEWNGRVAELTTDVNHVVIAPSH